MTRDRWTWHGGGLSAARAHFGDDARGWIDFSTGINPHVWHGAGAVEIDWRALPDEMALRALEQAAAASFGCHADHVCAVPGTEVGLRLAGRVLGDDVCHAVPSYRTHGEMAASSHPVTLGNLALADGSSLILANPNNPDGVLLSREALSDLLVRRGRKGWLVIDEAFADCHPDHSFADQVDDRHRLLIFRSFGKFFGLAGLRLGFVLGPRPILASLRKQLGAWPVSAAAIAIGTRAYQEIAWQDAMRERIIAEATSFDQRLASFGLLASGACPLFRLITTPDASHLFERLARAAILSRPFADKPDWLRFGLPANDEAMERLCAVLEDHG